MANLVPAAPMAAIDRAVWRVSGRRQVGLIALAVATAALAALPLKLQQHMVNDLVEGARRRVWSPSAPCSSVPTSSVPG